ncbi:MAG: hypothetical protein QOI81_1192 [Actinomycetota bacterium]|nr:hypothetical protein [Actinomycetota bacterium]
MVPDRQGEGIGSALLRDGLERADAQGIPSWLETSKARNAAYYEGFGFVTLADERAPDDGPRIWFMRREPA